MRNNDLQAHGGPETAELAEAEDGDDGWCFLSAKRRGDRRKFNPSPRSQEAGLDWSSSSRLVRTRFS